MECYSMSDKANEGVKVVLEENIDDYLLYLALILRIKIFVKPFKNNSTYTKGFLLGFQYRIADFRTKSYLLCCADFEEF